ncbi:uncharacterized protein LOC101860608, partial [Aplysia californica]|uniref:Uncharacterized protein LOC101860608 n=1 Tax=Aplysia californica TaxID=6500 RepID=A0ABM1AAH4_APLCA
MFFPIWKGVGVAALLDLVLLVSTYAPVTAQLGTYAFIALSRQPYQWGSCDLLKHVTVQGEVCVEELTATAIGPVGATFHRPEEIFYKREFLQLSSSIEKIDGFPHWRFIDLARKADISLMPVTLACVWVLVSLFVGCGARVCGWVLFLLGLSGLSCLLTVLGYGYHNLD